MTFDERPTVRLRLAGVQDTDILFEWANEGLVRLNSFSPEQIVFSDHQEWLHDRIESSESMLLIAENEEGQRVGQIRFDASRPETADIDFHVSVTHHGRGYGTQLLVEGFRFVVQDGRFRRVRGIVKIANTASRRCFEKAGFSQEATIEHRGESCYLFTLETESG
jgi:RimJ/RimL family protein N-acetyltransferase